jgi:hypothetical protein
MRLIAEIELLRNGKHFFGLLQSNLVRLVYRLGIPALIMHPYLKHLVDNDVNLRLDNLMT